MSRLVNEGRAAFSRWVQQNPNVPMPVVRVLLSSGQEFYFNGLAVAPTLDFPKAAVLSSLGANTSTLIVRDDDVFLIEIEPVF